LAAGEGFSHPPPGDMSVFRDAAGDDDEEDVEEAPLAAAVDEDEDESQEFSVPLVSARNWPTSARLLCSSPASSSLSCLPECGVPKVPFTPVFTASRSFSDDDDDDDDDGNFATPGDAGDGDDQAAAVAIAEAAANAAAATPDWEEEEGDGEAAQGAAGGAKVKMRGFSIRPPSMMARRIAAKDMTAAEAGNGAPGSQTVRTKSPGRSSDSGLVGEDGDATHRSTAPLPPLPAFTVPASSPSRGTSWRGSGS